MGCGPLGGEVPERHIVSSMGCGPLVWRGARKIARRQQAGSEIHDYRHLVCLSIHHCFVSSSYLWSIRCDRCGSWGQCSGCSYLNGLTTPMEVTEQRGLYGRSYVLGQFSQDQPALLLVISTDVQGIRPAFQASGDAPRDHGTLTCLLYPGLLWVVE